MYNSFAFEERKDSNKEVRPSSKGGGNPSGDKKGPFPPKLKGQGPNGENNMNQIFKTVLLWLLMIVGVYALIRMFNPGGDPTAVEVSTTYYQELLNNNKIASGEVEQYGLNMYRFHGTLNQKENLKPLKGEKVVMTDKFVTNLIPETLSEQNKAWTEKGIQITKQDSDSSWTTGLISFLPWIIIIAVWIMIMRRMQGGGGMNGPKGLFSFGKSKAKLLTEGATKVTFNDVSGCDEAKVELHEVIEFLKEPQKFQRLGGKIPKGVLLLGPPGTGKTLLARAVAGEAGVPFLSISGADFVEMFVGVGASRVRDLFEQAKKNAPCIVFIDEIDAVGRHRGAGMGGGHDEREQTLNQLLVEMDGFEQNSGVIMIAATNRPDVLDPALLRPGRFDRQVVVDRPDLRGREGILRVHTRTVPLSPDVDLNTLAKGTPGLSGADLANLVNEAALLAARRNGDRVTMLDFENAKDKVMMGVERRSVIISDEEKKITSYHECGHVLVAKKIPEADPVHKVTIIPRGRALGVTTYLPIDEKHTYSKEYLEAVIAYALGGRAAEKLIFNRITTGAGNDIERATDIARKMVCDWGMSEKLGPLKYGAAEHEVFLGRDYGQQKNFSENTGRIIDDEIRGIVERGLHRAEAILAENIDELHRISNALLERETLEGHELDTILNGGTLPPFEKRVEPQPTQERKFKIADDVVTPPLKDLGGIAPMPA